MGGSHSRDQYQPRAHRNTDATDAIPVQELLMKMSAKTKELQETISNMQKKPMEDGVARPYLCGVLTTAEAEILQMKESLLPHGSCSYQAQHKAETNKPKSQRWEEEIRLLKQQLQQSTSEKNKLKEENDRLVKQNETNKQSLDDLSKKNAASKVEVQNLQSFVETLQKEKKELYLRLSKLTADKLTVDNPNITDLSDPNRPTRLVEMMSELYDNEWTEAFIALQPVKNDEQKTVRILLQTFMDIYSFCKTKSSGLLSLTDESAKDPFEDIDKTFKEQIRMDKHQTVLPPKHRGEASFPWNPICFEWQNTTDESEIERSGSFSVKTEDVRTKLENELKKMKKGIGSAMVPLITKAYLQLRWNKYCLGALKPYIKKCLYVTWMMRVQTPPMAIATLPKQGDAFDPNLYTAYSKRGQKIDFVVWPAVLLTEPQSAQAPTIMKKGVVEAIETTAKATGVSRKQ